MNKKAGRWLAAGVVLAVTVLAAVAVFTVNRKINSLHDTVVELQKGQKELADLRSEEIPAVAAVDRTAYIPDLLPYDGGWKITQFGDAMRSQEICYTITTDTGLVIVDGGWDYEEERLRKIIAQYGNSVEAWILTHAHIDHISAFLNIYKDLQGIEIHHVYFPAIPSPEVLKENADWDDYSLLEELQGLDIPGLEYLEKGDVRNVLGLEMEVLNAYTDEVDEICDDLMNNASMMFRLRGEEESILFCSDVGSAEKKSRKAMTKYLTEEYGENLKSDYVQMAHHGFNGLGEKFYRLVDPKAAFFDAPAWEMNGSHETINTIEKEKLMREMGSVIFSYYTAPNQILLK